jgi:glycosyltransferase involved in cell wall biosynthesis
MSERLRVVHVIDSLAASGGAENRLVDEVLSLTERFDQTLVRLYQRDDLAAPLEHAGVPVVPLGFDAARAGWSWPRASRRLARLVRSIEPDVIHTSLFSGNLVGQLAGWRSDVPVVSTFNRTGELALQRALQPGVASWRGALMQRIARHAARRGDVHYRAVGEYAAVTNTALMGLPSKAVTVIPRGVALPPRDAADGAGSPADRRPFGVPDGVPLFVNVARLVPEKGQHLLIEAFARVLAQEPTAHLAIAGAPGHAEAAVRDAIDSAGVGSAVHLLGFRDDARALVRAADVFAFSSVSEGSPGAVVEAMALGTPVAGFGIPPVSELTRGGRLGWLARPGDTGALADAMMAALHSPDSACRAAAARAFAEEHYTLAAVSERLGDLLEARAVSAPARRPPGRGARRGRGASAATSPRVRSG